jgi:membrane protease YdiL (CAAX protease family)
MAAYLAVLAVAAVLLYFVGLTLVPPNAQGAFALVGLGVVEGASLGAVLLVWHFVDRQPLSELGLHSTGATQRWLRGAGVAALMMGFIVLAWYTLLDGATWDVNPDPVRATVVLVGGLLGFAVQGPAEELVFRGYILENVRAQWGLRWAVVVSSIAFGLLHARNPAFGPLPFVNLVLFGVATALYKVKIDNGQLWGVFGIHTVWNWLQQVVFGLPNSGIASLADNAVFTVTPNVTLPDPISGGGFGPEGTLAASLVLLALIGVTLRRPTTKSRS